MKLSELKPAPGSRKKRKRIGRGGAHGGTAGKGAKGQLARAGAKLKPGFEGGQMPLTRRLPKRGFRNRFRRDIVAVNIAQLKSFPEGSTVDVEALLVRGIIKRRGDGVKVLGKGDIGYPLKLKVNGISEAARAKVEAAGGSVEVV
ncbi:MAG TPA: 50S ribosomal protein L15 [Syntrophales bacterium]|jgi:large subunit ribosomal protein L15|nr:50S ribosomal protein L15 [Syntrophales bacterium]